MKIVASMATCEGRESCKWDAIKSIQPQVDELHVYDNTKLPDIGDAGKFDPLHKYLGRGDVLFLTLDDDLIYPPDYVSTVLKFMYKNCRSEKWDILTFHGRTLYKPYARNYYEDVCKVRVRCLGDSPGAFVEVGGTGVMAFTCDKFKEFPTFERKDAADIAIAGYARKHGLKIYAAPHKAGWIKHTDKIDVKDTIFYKANRKEITQYYNRVML